LHAEGKTEEARADLARLAIIKQQRAEAAKRREEERRGTRVLATLCIIIRIKTISMAVKMFLFSRKRSSKTDKNGTSPKSPWQEDDMILEAYLRCHLLNDVSMSGFVWNF
jgi:hypothetical protein